MKFDLCRRLLQKVTASKTKTLKTKTKTLKTHLIYAGDYYTYTSINNIVWRGLVIHNLESLIVTRIHMYREFLITKEQMEDIYLGKKLIYDEFRRNWYSSEESINDDIESFYHALHDGKELHPLKEYDSDTYFLPKLTQIELELVETKDQDYFQTFFLFENPDIDEEDMKLSESKSKYALVICRRRTDTVKKDFYSSDEMIDLNSSNFIPQTKNQLD